MSEILNRMVEVKLPKADSFLIVKETLGRIGIASIESKRLHQTCHILHKAGKYYISHFKLLFELDGKTSNIDANDISRQNAIAHMLARWGLVELISKDVSYDSAISKGIKVVPVVEKSQWEFVAKHRIGNKRG